MGGGARSSGTRPPRSHRLVYELLNAAEQRLLARMAVFSGGCTLEAIEEVCSGDPIEREEVMDLVTGLVARSLVVAEDSGPGTRFRMLETIRQYGEERLADWGETDDLLIRHARFYADLSARAAEHYYGPDQIAWARQINLERDNIRAALATAIDTANASAGRTACGQPPHHHGYGGTGEVFELADAGFARTRHAECPRRSRISPRADDGGLARVPTRRLRGRRCAQQASARS